MGNWGIAKTATPKEKLKSEMADFLNGLNSVGEISYSTYCSIFDFSMNLLDKMYDLENSEEEEKCSHSENGKCYHCSSQGELECNGTELEESNCAEHNEVD